MRVSASSIKKPGYGLQLQEIPRADTRLRRVYDQAIKGNWFTLSELNVDYRANTLDQLRIYYNLEIECKRVGRTAQYRCIGRWDGREFVTIQQVEEAIEHTLKEN